MIIQNAYEQKLHDDPKTTNGSNMQFVLKNMSWADKVDLNHGGQKDNPISVISADMSAADATRAYTDMMRK